VGVTVRHSSTMNRQSSNRATLFSTSTLLHE